MRAFLNELCNRPSCHDCQCRELRSGSDLTIADFWGVEKILPDFDDDHGTSLVLANTEKGTMLLHSQESLIDIRHTSLDAAIAGNPALVRSPKPHRNRTRFLEKCRTSDFEKLVGRMLLPPLRTRVRSVIVRIVRKLGFRK